MSSVVIETLRLTSPCHLWLNNGIFHKYEGIYIHNLYFNFRKETILMVYQNVVLMLSDLHFVPTQLRVCSVQLMIKLS